MGQHFENAQDWVDNAADLSSEQLEGAIERLGFLQKETPQLSEEGRADVQKAIEYLNGVLATYSGDDMTVGHQRSAPVAVHTDNEASGLSTDPLGEEPSEPMSTSQGRACLAKMLSDGLLSKGMRRTT